VPGVPPLTSAGKSSMAFDLGSGILPGATRGNALLNAHTWPDGSALGNKLLAKLHKGDPILVSGPGGGICYRVTDRVEVPADDPGTRYYAKKGAPQIAIVVCSGKRIGPGEWTKRTLWFASPVA
jgi:sortase (surface protein transpeptidase)